MIPNLVVDGWVFPAQLYEIYERGEQHDVPFIIGFTSNDGHQQTECIDWKAHLPSDAQDYAKMVRARYGHLADEYLSLYPAGHPATVDDPAWIAPIRDGFYTWPHLKVVRESRHVSSNVYLYYFDQRSPWQGRGGPAHSTDLPYVFNNWNHWNGIHPTQADVRLADTIQITGSPLQKRGAGVARH
ncbi:MAG: carboxylesterase family protein [Mesorhizobium sp.]|nr:MAG: carboxylesterase family protein [Mesorhizobium sp.]